MDRLRSLCESLGYTDVETYLQSGNIVLRSRSARATLAPQLSSAIREEFGFSELDVLAFTCAELQSIVDRNPFVADGRDQSQLHTTFLGKNIKASRIEAIDVDSHLPDAFVPGPRVIYVYCHDGYQRTKLTTGFFEGKLGVRATTRNWRTTTKLWQMACEH